MVNLDWVTAPVHLSRQYACVGCDTDSHILFEDWRPAKWLRTLTDFFGKNLIVSTTLTVLYVRLLNTRFYPNISLALQVFHEAVLPGTCFALLLCSRVSSFCQPRPGGFPIESLNMGVLHTMTQAGRTIIMSLNGYQNLHCC